MAADLGTTMDAILSCLCDALADAGRPVCACGTTVGAPMLSAVTGQCCACDDGEGQLSVTLQRMYPADGISFAQIAKVADCKPGVVAADLAFTLARCHPTVTEQGTPSLDELADVSDGITDDVQTMWNALTCCTGHKLVIRDLAVDTPPQGGCSAVLVRVSVLVKPLTPVVAS